MYDLSISGLLGHVRVATTERITHVLSSATHPFMIAAIDVLPCFPSSAELDAVRLALCVGAEHVRPPHGPTNGRKGMLSFVVEPDSSNRKHWTVFRSP